MSPANDVYVADVDGDGDLDVVAASGSADTVTVYRNDGLQQFTASVIHVDADDVTSVVAADLDGDQDLDVVSGNPWLRKIFSYENVPAVDLSVDATEIFEDAGGTVTFVFERSGELDPRYPRNVRTRRRGGTRRRLSARGDKISLTATWGPFGFHPEARPPN